MSGRYFLIFLALTAAYSVQHEADIKRWWRQHSPARSAQVAAPGAGVKVYTANGCGPCADAIALLGDAGVVVRVLNTDTDDNAKADVESISGGRMPLIVDGEHHMSGFDPEFLQGWYVERPSNTVRLNQMGVYRAGEVRLPILYGTTWCGYCKQARQYFADHGMAFRDLDIEHDAEAKRQYDALGLSGVPVMVYEDMIWSGFSAERMAAKQQWVGDVR